MGMKSFVARRIATMIMTLFVFATIMFVVFRIMPGDPTLVFESASLNPESREVMRQNFGLDKPFHEQYLIYIKNILTFNLGVSFHRNQPVAPIIVDRAINSFLLMGTAFFFVYIIGPVLGALAAWKQGGQYDRTAFVSAIVFRSMPRFFLGVLLLIVFSHQLEWFPLGHMAETGTTYDSKLDLILSWSFVHHMVLPVLSLVGYTTGLILLLMRTSMLKTIGQSYIKMGRARGLSKYRVLYKHAARNALLPVVTAIPTSIGSAIAGNVLIETIFSWPGLGRLLVRSIQQQDYPLAQGAFLGIALIYILGNFAADLTYAGLDPRITYGGEEK